MYVRHLRKTRCQTCNTQQTRLRVQQLQRSPGRQPQHRAVIVLAQTDPRLWWMKTPRTLAPFCERPSSLRGRRPNGGRVAKVQSLCDRKTNYAAHTTGMLHRAKTTRPPPHPLLTKALAMTLTRTSPFWGGATSISSTFKGSFAAHATAALHLDSKEEERGKSSTKRATRTQTHMRENTRTSR